ncbi:hypothetical protein ACWFRB_02830 [Rhodococcus sp. NPDC055112]
MPGKNFRGFAADAGEFVALRGLDRGDTADAVTEQPRELSGSGGEP